MVNALAFSASNYLFSMLRISDLNEERKRQDQAVEQLQAAQAKWSRKRTERLDWINETFVVRATPSRPFEMSTTQCANTRGSPEQNLTPWDLSPSCQTSTCQAVAVRLLSLYWGLPRPAWWPTNSLSNCMQASIAYFFWPLIAYCFATQHNWTDSWVRDFRMLEAYLAVGIPRRSQKKSCQPFTTVHEVTGRGSQP